jgi:uncharacterized protein
MKKELEKKLAQIAEKHQIKTDPSHDFQHVIRTTNLAKKIAREVDADLDVIIPSALFHDIILYPKNNPRRKYSSEESAEMAEKILKKIKGFPKNKIDKIKTCIKECSFTKGIVPDLLESKVLQDADGLESTGAISIARTFSSSGQMNRQFYDPKNPICKSETEDISSGIDLFYKRLLVVEKRMHTKYAKQIAKKRTGFLRKFLKEFEQELEESCIINL